MKPSGKTRNLIGGILARYQEIFEIELYAYTVLGNHYHLLIKAPKGNTDEFCENVNREIAKRINWKVKREGSLWGRRYDDQEVLREEDLKEAFLYVTTNVTRHGLLRDPSKWEGLHCVDHVLQERDREFSFIHYSERDATGAPKVTKHKLRLSILPEYVGYTKKKRKGVMAKLLKERISQLIEKRAGKPFLGVTKIRAQAVGGAPENVSRTPRPDCYCFSPERIEEYREQRRELHKRYAECSLKFRLGRLSEKFPAYTFHPPLHRTPRVVRFTPLSEKYLAQCS